MYYNLSKNIYRFMGGPSKGSSGVVGHPADFNGDTTDHSAYCE
jgi:hypothetical protein